MMKPPKPNPSGYEKLPNIEYEAEPISSHKTRMRSYYMRQMIEQDNSSNRSIPSNPKHVATPNNQHYLIKPFLSS